MMKIKTFLILCIGFIWACSKYEQNPTQGLYKYSFSECEAKKTSDTVLATVHCTGSADSMKMIIDLVGFTIGTKDAILGVWTVDSVNGKLKADHYTLYSKKLKTGDRWSLNQELSFSKSRQPISFWCLSSDTVINTNNRTFLNVTLVEKREVFDVGNIQKVTLYGFDQEGKIVIIRVHDVNAYGKPIGAECYELSLLDFEHVANYDSALFEGWISRNSAHIKELIFGLFPDSLINQMPLPPHEIK